VPSICSLSPSLITRVGLIALTTAAAGVQSVAVPQMSPAAVITGSSLTVPRLRADDADATASTPTPAATMHAKSRRIAASSCVWFLAVGLRPAVGRGVDDPGLR
jgi:hypothetical protein